MNKICGIYKITSPSGKIYIGQSRNITKRINYYMNSGCKRQPKLYNSIIKYGWECHSFEIICECDENMLDELESHYIKLFDCFDNEHGLNLTSGGNFTKFSNKTKEKMSTVKKNKKLSKEHKIKIGILKINNKNWLGKTHSIETKEKMSQIKRGKLLSDEHKQKISESLKGKTLNKKLSTEHKLKISLSNKGKIPHNKNKKMSVDAKNNMSIAHLGKIHSNKTKEKMSIARRKYYASKTDL